MKRLMVFLYGFVCYGVFFATFLYMIGFVGNLFVPRTIDSGVAPSLGQALTIDGLLLLLFGLQHSVMARPTFKRWIARMIPQPIERSTYVLFSSLALILLFVAWQPIPGIVWQATSTWAQAILYTLYACGWLGVLITTFLLNHFDLFGLRQSGLYALGKPYKFLKFRTPGPYRLVRHPLYVGWITTFWATPVMSWGHILFATVLTGYILIAIRLEERNLVEDLPGYSEYRKQVPMLVPFTGQRDPQPELEPVPAPAMALADGNVASMKTVATRHS